MVHIATIGKEIVLLNEIAIYMLLTNKQKLIECNCIMKSWKTHEKVNLNSI